MRKEIKRLTTAQFAIIMMKSVFSVRLPRLKMDIAIMIFHKA